MALPASGNSISLDQIHVELGESSGTTVALGDTDVRNLASDTSGAIAMNQFFGLSSASNIEDVFSTFVYKGDGSTRNIVNGLNLSGDGGLVWIKNREQTDNHVLVDTARGVTKVLSANNGDQESTDTDTVTAFNNNGFSLGADVKVNTNNEDYVAWVWKKQAGFFDIVTYTGNGSSQNISHSLGIVPGMIAVKARNVGENFAIWHPNSINSSAGTARGSYISFANEGGSSNDTDFWNNTDPTSSVFTVGDKGDTNQNGKLYVAYLWGHQANDADAPLISCGTYTGNQVYLSDSGAFNSVNCGFEPEFIMVKGVDITSPWVVVDKMRGLAAYRTNGNERLRWNETAAEATKTFFSPTPTGFDLISSGNEVNDNNIKYIYMAIRNGPMAEPTAGSEVLSIDTDGSAAPYFDSAHPVDMAIVHRTGKKFLFARKQHTGEITIGSSAFNANASEAQWDFMDGWSSGSFGSGAISYMFHDRVKAFTTQSYRGTGSARTIAHRLGATPELIVVQNMSATNDATIYYGVNTDHLHWSTSGTASNIPFWNDTSPTSSVFSVGDGDPNNSTAHVNANNNFYFAFMFATLAGVTKVGTVNVTGATDVDCGFSSGAKFVMIKRYSGNGHWLVFDTTSGLVAGNDTYRKLEHNSAAVTNADVIDPLNAGFSLTADFLNITNNGSGDYVFVAIAA